MKKILFVLFLLIPIFSYSQKQFFGNFVGSTEKAMIQENRKIAYYNTYYQIGEIIKVPTIDKPSQKIKFKLDSIHCYSKENDIPKYFFKKDNALENKEVRSIEYYFSLNDDVYRFRLSLTNLYSGKKYSLFFDNKKSKLEILTIGKYPMYPAEIIYDFDLNTHVNSRGRK